MKHPFVVFLGVDGSGKSTLINKLKIIYPENYSFHFCPTKRYNKSNIANENPHGKTEYSVLISLIKLVFLIIQFNLGFIFNIKSKKVLTIGDRYFYDLYIDSKRYRLNVPKNIVKFLLYFIPSPDFVFLCVGEPTRILKRKSEISINEIEIQQGSLLKLASGKENWLVVDTTENSCEQLIKRINEVLDT